MTPPFGCANIAAECFMLDFLVLSRICDGPEKARWYEARADGTRVVSITIRPNRRRAHPQEERHVFLRVTALSEVPGRDDLGFEGWIAETAEPIIGRALDDIDPNLAQFVAGNFFLPNRSNGAVWEETPERAAVSGAEPWILQLTSGGGPSLVVVAARSEAEAARMAGLTVLRENPRRYTKFHPDFGDYNCAISRAADCPNAI